MDVRRLMAHIMELALPFVDDSSRKKLELWKFHYEQLIIKLQSMSQDELIINELVEIVDNSIYLFNTCYDDYITK